MLKIVLVGLTAVFLVLAAGSVHREYAFLIGLCGAVLIFSYGLGRIRIIADYVRLTFFAPLAARSVAVSVYSRRADLAHDYRLIRAARFTDPLDLLVVSL